MAELFMMSFKFYGSVKATELNGQYEVNRRRPYSYSGGFGGVSFMGDVDIAFGLGTMVFPTEARYDMMSLYKNADNRCEWVADLQATCLAHAIDLAELASNGN
ncbi:hypothetical protein GH714_037051 [Hevea brasiliensis]|uniref:Uncharacterized protein n=1 Tax=Hevea brasiliensis TaxID=3981 RepID=A0A6A6L4D8_HEVBR|nr:hypothetical protein GH714_037051 [Hevea brasiliensis]